MSTSANAARPDLGALRIDKDKRQERKTGKIFGIILAAILVVALVAGATFYSRNSAPVVEVAAAQKAGNAGPTALLNASGYVTPRRRATIAAKITGRVIGVYFDEGVHVKEGQILAKLDDSDVKRALDSAVADRNSTRAQIADYEVQLKNAELLVHRSKELQAAGVQSQEILDNAVTSADSLRAKIALTKEQVAAAESRINEAQQAVDNTVIRAPFEGIVVSKDAQVGEMVSPISAGGGFTRTGICTLVDMSSLEVEVDVNENYIHRVSAGQPVEAVPDAYPDRKIPARVIAIIPTADRQKGTVKVRIGFEALDPRMLPDMGVKVSFQAGPLAPTAAAGVLLPPSAVHEENGHQVVWVLRDGRAQRRAVQVNATNDNQMLQHCGRRNSYS